MMYILVVGGGIAAIGWTIVLLDWYARRKERGLPRHAGQPTTKRANA